MENKPKIAICIVLRVLHLEQFINKRNQVQTDSVHCGSSVQHQAVERKNK